MEELAPLLESSAEQPRNAQAMSTKDPCAHTRPAPEGRRIQAGAGEALAGRCQSRGVNAQVVSSPEGTPRWGSVNMARDSRILSRLSAGIREHLFWVQRESVLI